MTDDTADGGADYAVLDLFCGVGGFSQSFATSDRWGVTTVDVSNQFNPDITADVFTLCPSDFDCEYDVVLASPPCTQFSLAASRYERFLEGEPKTPEARDAVALVYHTLGLIRGLNPQYWLLENPKGHLRNVIGSPDEHITLCQYGTRYMKPTDLWGDAPPMMYRSCSLGDDCHIGGSDKPRPRGRPPEDGATPPGEAEEDGGDVAVYDQRLPTAKCSSAGMSAVSPTQSDADSAMTAQTTSTDDTPNFGDCVGDPAQRAALPEALSKALRTACERGLDGHVERTTLNAFIDDGE